MFFGLILISVMGVSQVPGFNGRLFSASIGTSFNSNYYNLQPNYDLNETKINSYLPPKIRLNLELAISQRTTVYSSFSFLGLPHSEYFIKQTERQPNFESISIDSILLKSNMWSVSLGFRKYAEFTHYGKFWNLGFSGNYYNTEIYPTLYKKTTNNGIVTQHQIEKIKPGRQWTYNVALFVGRGRRFVTPKNLTIDYGVNFWLFLGKSKRFNVGADYREDLPDAVDHLVYKRAQEAHMIELFFNFGILR